MKKLIISLVASIAGLAACGGSDSSAPAPVTPTPTPPVVTTLTGRYLDAAVSGLQYSTATQSGTTNAAGEYTYLAGETVSFKLYGVEISHAAAAQVVTPVDSVDVNIDEIINVLRFLQTIDTDNNASNGITLPAITDAFAVNFKQDIFAFETNAAVTAFLSKYASGRPLVSVKTAVDHFGATAAAVNQGAVLSLAGKTATSVATNDYCSNGLKLGWQYSFTATAMVLTGSDTFSTTGSSTVCSDGGQETLNLNYANDLVAGDFLKCAPNCTYAGINQMKYITDSDARTAVQLSWYMPGTKKIYNIKRIVTVPGSLTGKDAALSTFREVLTLD